LLSLLLRIEMMVLRALEGPKKENNLTMRNSAATGGSSITPISTLSPSMGLSKRRKLKVPPDRYQSPGLSSSELRMYQTSNVTTQNTVTNDPTDTSTTITGSLVLMCVQHALARNPQLALCPPGRNRRTLQAALRSQKVKSKNSLLLSYPDNFLLESSTNEEEEYFTEGGMSAFEREEVESSGDEDEMYDVKELLMGTISSTPISNSSLLRESLFTRKSDDSCKLPFAFRKLIYFDAVTASDRKIAREYLQQVQIKAKRRVILQKLNKPTDAFDDTPVLDHPGKYSAALLLESLLLNPLESIEGMSKCYDGIVAAGVALQQNGNRNQVLQALSPLLISSLEQVSGQVMLCLAKLRHCCGTPRYQRRFIQRIGPCLVRPSLGAPWCLRHQQDMEAILAACELIFDSAEDLFSGSWYEKGRQLLADSVRKQTLHAAAQQLKDLSPTPSLFSSSRRLKVSLAEWEVMAVDQQIRISISNIFKKDWKVSAMPVREAEFKSRRRLAKQILQSPKSPNRPKAHKAYNTHGAPPIPDEFDVPMSPSRGVVKTPPRLQASPPNTPQSPDNQRYQIQHEAGIQPSPQIAPLSPQTPVGGSTEYRLSSNTSVTSLGSSSNVQAINYRMLTSTAAERKRTVAACRALRSQIQRFEEAFMHLHGRPPKGASERAPLATTYAQYREWKRAIRADAACRIQALVRGARTRWALLRSNNSRMSRVVMTRAGRKTLNASLDKLSLPLELSSETSDRNSMGGISAPMLSQVNKPETLDLFMNNSKMQLSTVSNSGWATPTSQARKTASQSPIMPSLLLSSNNSPTNDLMQLSLPDLMIRKRDLKQHLKQYDMSFARKHGRMPVKAEKEPIRHVYEMYNLLKNRISLLEKEQSTSVPVLVPRQHPSNSINRGMQSSPTVNNSSSVQSGNRISETGQNAQARSTSHVSSGQMRPSSQQQKSQNFVVPPPPVEIPSPPPPMEERSNHSSSAAQELSQLKIEKARLHQMLRSYEKDFYREHGRQVSSFAEIKPVASQYRRYKEIKKAIATLQLQVDSEATPKSINRNKG
jgi:hypothetical protein